MASKTSAQHVPCAKYKTVLEPLRSRLEEVLKEKSHVVALRCCLRGEKDETKLQNMLKERYKHLYQCEKNCRAIHGLVCKERRKGKSTLAHAPQSITPLAVAN